MEHIRQYDWCSSKPDIHFVEETDIDNCVTERILSNRFRDPMISSDSENEDRPKIDLSSVFNQRKIEVRQHRVYVPGMRSAPPYAKLSALTAYQHFQCLKVLCSENPDILKVEFIQRPTKQDHKILKEIEDKYLTEQKEYIQWAKTQWTTQCVRALRPKPPIEMVYEAEFKLKAKELDSFPKDYEMAAQIPLETRNSKCEMIYNEDLISVPMTALPQIQYPELTRRIDILRPCSVPEPCNKHPCRFVLPNEKSMSILPLTEVHRELAQYALDNGARHVASEKALRCLVELERFWSIPLSVCQVISADGDKCNVIVMGSEFSVHRECARTRTYKAYRHMLERTLVLTSKTPAKESDALRGRLNNHQDVSDSTMDVSSDEEDGNLLIADEDAQMKPESEEDPELDRNLHELKQLMQADKMSPKKPDDKAKSSPGKRSENSEKNEFYQCNCKDSAFEKPPPRSFKKWQVRNSTTHETYSIIVHTSHKVRGAIHEMILEPIPEYQIDLGGSMQSEHKVKSLALSLLLRRTASLLNVRVDGPTGEIVAVDNVYLEEYIKRHGDVIPDISNRVFTALDQLQGLLPGNYILQHEPSHGNNALLYATRMKGAGQKLSLQFDCSQLAETDEAKSLKTPPTLAPVLLPMHKFRRILPCAFTPHEYQVAKEPKKPVTRQKTPPQAIKWPRRRKAKKKPNNRTE